MAQQDKNEERNIERLVEENRVLKEIAKNDDNIRTMLRNEIA